MAVEFDVYAPCPCGSGKKIKFCCLPIIGDLHRLPDLLQSHQFDAARQLIESMSKRAREASTRSYVKYLSAMILTNQGRVEEAHAELDEALRINPDMPPALELRGHIWLMSPDWQPHKREIYKAFEVARRSSGSTAQDFAFSLSRRLRDDGNLPAAIHVLVQSGGFTEESSDLKNAIYELLRQTNVLWPLRQFSLIQALDEELEAREDVVAAGELYLALELDLAAQAYERAAEARGKSAKLWAYAASCWLIFNNVADAVRCWRRAAEVEPDFELAVEYEVVAQCLEEQCLPPLNRLQSLEFSVRSVSQLLTQLDRSRHLLRLPVDPTREDGPVAAYEVLDRERPAEVNVQWTWENCPRVLGQAFIYAASADGVDPPEALIGGVRAQRAKEVRDIFLAAAGGESEFTDQVDLPASITAQESRIFDGHPALRLVPPAQHPHLLKAGLHHLTHDVWPHLAHPGLGGATPLAAMQRPELARRLSAAVCVFCATLDLLGFPSDENHERTRYGIPPLAPYAPSAPAHLASVSLLQARRLPLNEVSDSFLVYFINMAGLTSNRALLEPFTLERLARTPPDQPEDLADLNLTLATAAVDRLAMEEGRAFLDRARQAINSARYPLEERFNFDMRELGLRCRIDDMVPAQALAVQMWNAYALKLHIGDSLRAIFSRLGFSGPWNDAEPAPHAPELVGSVSTGGIWTPGAAPVAGGGKLWVPGAD